MEPEKEPSLLENKKIMNNIILRLDHTVEVDDIKGLATKQDLTNIEGRISAQNAEINQLRDEMKELKGKF